MNSNKSGHRHMAIAGAWHRIGQRVADHTKRLCQKWQWKCRTWHRYALSSQGEKAIHLWLQLMLIAALALHVGVCLYMGQTVTRLIQY